MNRPKTPGKIIKANLSFQGRLVNKLGLTLSFVLMFAVVLCSLLNYFKFQENYRKLLFDRLEIVLQEVDYQIEFGLGLGLGLGEQEQINTILTRTIKADDRISSMLVIDKSGTVLFIKGSMGQAQMALTTWQLNWQLSSQQQLSEQKNAIVFSSGLVNSFGQTEGYLLLVYEKNEFISVVERVKGNLVKNAILAIFLTSFVGLFILYLLLRPTLKSLQRMLESLVQLESGKQPELNIGNANGVIERELAEMEQVYQGEAISHQLTVEEKKQSAKDVLLILATTIALIVGGTMLAAWYQIDIFKAELLPQEEKKAQVIAGQVAQKVSYLLDEGVPFDRIRGLEATFRPIQDLHQDVQIITLASSEGKLSHGRNTVGQSFQQINDIKSRFNLYATPIQKNGAAVASVVVGIDPAVMIQSMQEIVLDIAAILVVSALLATELILFIVSYTLTTPLMTLRKVIESASRGDFNQGVKIIFRDEVGRLGEKLNHFLDIARQKIHSSGQKLTKPIMHSSVSVSFVRPPLFLLVFSESMSLSFFPAYVDSMYEPIGNLSHSMVIGLPISVFMAMWALSLPWAGQWSDNVGRRRAFMAGATITALGLLATGFAENLWFLLVARCLTAVGYGLVFITAQGFITDNSDPGNRTKGMATFLSGFFSGSLCGAAIGGILSDRIGFESTFYLSAILSLTSALFVTQFFAKEEPVNNKRADTKLTWSDFGTLWRNPHFLVITLFSAIPAKVALTGFLYYSAPMFMKDHLEVSQSSAGRVLMAYGLAIILISPLSAWLVDQFKKKKTFIALGGLLSGGALCSLYYIPNEQGILLSVMLLGIAHAIGIAPQMALLTELLVGKVNVSVGKIIGIFRMSERIGNISGPLIAAALITAYGYEEAFLWFAAFLVVNVVVLLLLLTVATAWEKRKMLKEQHSGQEAKI